MTNAVGSAHNVIAAFFPPLVGIPAATSTAHSTISIIDGGTQRITGTVKNTGTPAAPVFRRVRLHDQRSGRVVSETWSNATTGAYAFDYLAPGTYYVTAFDHTGQYGGVVETDIAPEPMP